MAWRSARGRGGGGEREGMVTGEIDTCIRFDSFYPLVRKLLSY